MGMFDYLKIDLDLLPESNDIKHLLKENEFQTKSYECLMYEIEIKSNGNLYYDGNRIKRDINISFYTYIDRVCIRYDAFFEKGKLSRINRLS